MGTNQENRNTMQIHNVVVTAIAVLLIFLATFFSTRSAFAETVCGVSSDRLEVYKLRIEPFAYEIQTTLKHFNVDEQFIWLAMIESGGRPNAASNKGAAGLWQLTSPTSKHYGCPPDKRSDVSCSTMAAAKYLAKLLKDFENNHWKAIVGYNMGGTNYRKAGKPTRAASNLANTVTCLMEELPYEY